MIRRAFLSLRTVKVLFMALIFVGTWSTAVYAQAQDPNSPDYYVRLGISRNANEDDIKKAYRKLARKYHPDLAGDENRLAFQNVKEAYEALTGAGDRSRAESAAPEAWAQNLHVDRDQVLNELYDHFESNRQNSKVELEILLKVFTALGKYDIEHMMGDKRFAPLREKIFTSSVWRENNPLFDMFVEGWGLYSFRTSTDLLAKLFASLDAHDPRLQGVTESFDFSSPGGDFQNRTGRKNWLMLAVVKMMKLEPYRDSKLGLNLLERQYGLWQSMKAGEDLSPYPRDLWVIELLGLLEYPEYAKQPHLIEIVREIPKLLQQKVIGSGGVFSDPISVNLFRSALRKHPRIFEGVVVNAPIDDLIWFYKSLTAKQRSSRKVTEGQILARVLSLDKYDFEAMMRDREFGEVMDRAAGSSIWKDRGNGLFALFVNGWGFYQMKYSSERIAKLFSQLDPEDRDLQRILYDAEFSSPGHDFKSRDKRIETVNPIIVEMLKTKSYRGTPAGEKLIRHLDRLWSQFKFRRSQATYMEDVWAMSILKTLDVPELRAHSTMIKIYHDIPGMLESGKVEFRYENGKKVFEDYRQKYADVFEVRVSPSSFTQAKEVSRPAPSKASLENPMALWCRFFLGGK